MVPLQVQARALGDPTRHKIFRYVAVASAQNAAAAASAARIAACSALSSETFSYEYAIPGYPSGKPAMFEYVNETTGGTFRMGSLVWVSFGNANRDAQPGDCDCVTFTGIGLWTKDMGGPHMCTVQISTAPEGQYVSIQIDGGLVSNVNTKPKQAVLPLASWTSPALH